MRIRKAISYAYATSTNAGILGVLETGGFHVDQQIMKENGQWSAPFIPQQCQGDVFQERNDPDLLALYHSLEGEPCPYMQRLNPVPELKA